MAGTSLLALLDDIVTLTKLAASKTAPVLTDDLAVNADKLSGGIRPERELPVVWKVFKGSMINKAIIVPIALAFSYFMPSMIPVLLVLGGAYLVYEGAEKVWESILHKKDNSALENALLDESVDLVEFEKEKIKGAIATDAVLSAEIIIIALGAMSDQTLQMKAFALIAIAIIMTVGVYGVVAGIVKIDDGAFYLLKDKTQSLIGKIKRSVGGFMLWFANKLMKFLSIAGTIAMFTVGGHIFAEQIHNVEQFVRNVASFADTMGSFVSIANPVFTLIAEVLVAFVIGSLLVTLHGIALKLKTSRN